MFCSMFTDFHITSLNAQAFLALGLSGADYVILLFGVLILFAVSMLQRKGSVRQRIGAKAAPVRFCVWYGLFLMVLLFGVYGIGYDASQFIYNRF